MLGFGMWWLTAPEAPRARKGEGFGDGGRSRAGLRRTMRPCASAPPPHTNSIPAEITHGAARRRCAAGRFRRVAAGRRGRRQSHHVAFVLPRLDTRSSPRPRWGATSLSAVGGVWAVVDRARRRRSQPLIAINFRRLPTLRATHGRRRQRLRPAVLSVASLVGFGAVVAALPAFAVVRDWVLGIEGGPLVSLAVATNVLAVLTGSASGGLTIALDALGAPIWSTRPSIGIDPALLHRVAVIGSGTLDSLPHNGAVVTLLAVCGSTHRESYLDIVMVAIVGAIVALVAVIVLGSVFGSF